MSGRDLYNAWVAKRQALGLPVDDAAQRVWEIETFSPKPAPIHQDQGKKS